MNLIKTTKKPWLSKTLWLNAVVATLSLTVPVAADLIKAHPEIMITVFAGVNIILRFLTEDKLQLTD